MSEPTVFHGVPKKRKRSSWSAIPVVEIKTRREIRRWDVVSVGSTHFYFDEDQWGGTLVREIAAIDSDGRELRRVIAPADAAAVLQDKIRGRAVRAVLPSAAVFSAVLIKPRGRQPRAAVAATERVTIRLTPEERARWESAAGKNNMGEWIRWVCNLYARNT